MTAMLTALTVAAPAAWAAPSVTITAPTNDQTVTSPSLTVEGSFSGTTQGDTVTGTVSVNGGASQALTITGSQFDGTVTLAAGADTIDVTITDSNQETGSTNGSATAAVTLQTVPVVTVDTPTVSGTTVDFTGTVSDTTVTQATVVFDGTALKTIPVSAGSFSSFVDTGTGSHTLAVSATNGVGTGTSTTQYVVVGTTTGGGGGGGAGGGITLAMPPIVDQVSPDTGPAAGGTTVVIDGSSLSGATVVDFGSNAATGVTVVSASQITAVSPPGSGTVDVQVTTPSGTSAAEFPDQFTYTATPPGAVPAGARPAGAVPAGRTTAFSDVPAGYWAAQSIATLAARGIIAGFPGGTFRPGDPVTRAQFVKMLVMTLGLAPGMGRTPFGDVPPSAWYAPYVSAAAGAGLVQGVSATAFAPDATLTREQMAVLIARALKLSGSAPLRFTDAASIAPWATSAVEAAVAAGYIAGFPGGSFRPLQTATRAQAAKVLAMALARVAPGGGTAASTGGAGASAA